MKTLFIDTNIIIDLIAQREPHYRSIAKIATLAEEKKLKLVASSVSFVNTFYVLSKFINKKTVLDILKKFRIICEVATVDASVIDKGLSSGFKDFEDAVQYHSATAFQCDVFITRNKKDFKNIGMPLMSAAEFLVSINKK